MGERRAGRAWRRAGAVLAAVVGGACAAAADERSDDEGALPFFSATERTPVRELSPLIGNVFARDSLSLAGEWRFIVDQLAIGDVSPILRGGIGADRRPADPGEVFEYSFDDAQVLNVPGDWNSQAPELFWYRGVGWYRKEFAFHRKPGTRVFLYFGGANFRKDVYLNGVLVARHAGGFTPFNVEVGDEIADGENALVVKVDSLSGEGDVPTERNDWLNYGGLTREVLVVSVPETFIRSYLVQLAPGTTNVVAGWVELDGAEATQRELELSLPALDAPLRVRSDADGRAAFRVEAEVELWSPESPRLHTVEIRSGDDTVREQIGFRSLATRGEDILLNGEPIFLYGVSMHEESVLHPGRAYGEEDAAAAVELIRGLGANFVRLAHYPHNEHMVRAADRAGLLVWSEIPVYHGIDFESPAALANAKQQLSEIIARDRNRASVALWSIANETPPGAARDAFLRELAKHVRAADPTRLVTAALLGFHGMEAVGRYLAARLQGADPEPPETVITDPLGETLDVIGYNQYLGWYVPTFMADAMKTPEAALRRAMLEALPHLSLSTTFGKPLIVSETGAGAVQGVRGDALDAWSEDLQAAVYRSELAMLLGNARALRGISPWLLKDFRAPYRMNTARQKYWNRKGLVSESGAKKLAYDVLREIYRAHASARGD